MLRISRKAESFTESVIREMNRVAVAYGAVSLAQGFPDFACPPELKRAVAEAVDADINQYAITWGSKPLRDAIAEMTPRHFPGFGEIDPEWDRTQEEYFFRRMAASARRAHPRSAPRLQE